MPDRTFIWYKVAEHINELVFGSNGVAVVEVNKKKVCVGEWQGGYFAFGYTCPHAGGNLSQGFIDALGNVVCPLHRYRYNIRDGRNVSGEGYHLRHWPVECREDGVYVAQDKGGLLGW